MKNLTKKMMALLLAAVLMLSLAACGGGGNTPSTTKGDDGKTYTLRIGTGSGGKETQNYFMEQFKEIAEKESNGKLVVELYPSGSLGNLAQLTQGVADGSVDSVCIPTTYFATVVPSMNLLDVPSLWEDSGHPIKALNSDPENIFNKEMAEKGMSVMTYVRNTNRMYLASKDLSKVNSLADLKALHMTTFCNTTELCQSVVTALGGTPSNIAVGEMGPALQNGTLDGALCACAIFNSLKLYQVAPYMLVQENSAQNSVFVINSEFLGKLPENLQEIVKKASKEASDKTFTYGENFEKELIDEMKAGGLNVITPSENLQKELDEAYAGVTDAFLKKYTNLQGAYDELVKLAEKNK
ncbi:MAG: TRAP transporter substrate-binding protein [Lachnospiraceae bacterium]|nr:TRAP transporter substrate-binding protein [Lachnospiraceae bacterium]